MSVVTVDTHPIQDAHMREKFQASLSMLIREMRRLIPDEIIEFSSPVDFKSALEEIAEFAADQVFQRYNVSDGNINHRATFDEFIENIQKMQRDINQI